MKEEEKDVQPEIIQIKNPMQAENLEELKIEPQPEVAEIENPYAMNIA